VIIHTPTLILQNGKARVSATVELKQRARETASELWFSFPASSLKDLSADCDPFVVALLLLAMQRQEAIEVRGILSEKLLSGLMAYQDVFHSWYPDRFFKIEIKPEGARSDLEKGNTEACAFSGGVDSFYTLSTLLEERPLRLKQALFMAGFDMPLGLTRSFDELAVSYTELARERSFDLVIGSTNVRSFLNTVDWTNAHGQALAASALFFKKKWSRFYIPSSYTGNTYPKWGTHPQLDGLLSVESLQFVHHGACANRVKKLERLIDRPETYDRLRVCWIQDIGLRNCGECEKCVRTMTALEILGALDRYQTFSTPERTRHNLRNLQHRTHQSRAFARELLGEALEKNRYGIAMDLAYSLLKREVRHRWRRTTAPRRISGWTAPR
jgi:hypothetical protein